MNSVKLSNVDSPERSLATRAAAGDRDARRELFERHREAAYRVGLRVTGRHEDALDVVQDGFIQAFERLESFQRDASFKTWLLRIVTNRALDLLRARKVRIAASFDADSDAAAEPAAEASIEGSNRSNQGVSDALERRETADRLQDSLEKLPPDQRAVMALYASGDMTYGQIAEVLGVPVGTVMSRLYHARRELRADLEDLAPADAEREKE